MDTISLEAEVNSEEGWYDPEDCDDSEAEDNAIDPGSCDWDWVIDQQVWRCSVCWRVS